jgi:peptidyl-tRNA hydrolase
MNTHADDILAECVEALVNSLYRKADRIDRCQRAIVKDKQERWVAQGSQKILSHVAHCLKMLHREHRDTFSLYQALQDYMHCLQTCEADAVEEAWGYRCRNRTAIERWKAAGEAKVLPRVSHSLYRLLNRYASLLPERSRWKADLLQEYGETLVYSRETWSKRESGMKKSGRRHVSNTPPKV